MSIFQNMKRYESIILTLLFVIVSLLTAVLMPTLDDWGTGPNFHPELSKLLPGENYWIPFQESYRWLLGLLPILYPYLNHVLVSFCYVVLIWLIIRITDLMLLKRNARIIAVIYFAVAPASAAHLVGVDSIAMAFSTMWGGLAVYAYLKYKGNRRIILYLLFSVLSVFSKENGIVWVFIAPFFYLLNHLDRNKSKTNILFAIKSIFTILLFIGSYIILRLFLSPEGVSIGSNDPDNYRHLSIFSFSFIQNIVTVFGFTLSTIDTLSVFIIPRNYILLILTFILGLPFLLFLFNRLFKKLVDKETRNKMLLFILLIGASAFPALLLGHVSENHTYATVFMMALFIAWLLNKNSWSRLHYVYVLLFVVGSLISSSRKYISAYSLGRSVIDTALALKEKTKGTPEKVLRLTYGGEREIGYSYYFQDKREAFGQVFRFVYDYKYPKKIDTASFLNVHQRDSIIHEKGSNYNSIWIIYKDSVNVINNYSDYKN